MKGWRNITIALKALNERFRQSGQNLYSLRSTIRQNPTTYELGVLVSGAVRDKPQNIGL
jgi:hypothetical protein